MTNELSSIIDLATRYGFAIFPCWPNNKTPACPDGCKQAAVDADSIKSLWNGRKLLNVGIEASRSNLVLLDVDAKDGRDGALALAELENRHGKLPVTLMAKTPSGGTHYYFKRPTGMKVENRKDVPAIGIGLEIRANNQYVVAPPSSIDGKPYEWMNPETTITDCPQWLADLSLIAPAKTVPQAPQKLLETRKLLDPSDTAEWAMRYARKAATANAGGRNDAAFKLAGHLWAIEGVCESDVINAMDDWNNGCNPPLDQYELDRVIYSARVNGTPRPTKENKPLVKKEYKQKEKSLYPKSDGPMNEAESSVPTPTGSASELLVVDWNTVEEGIDFLWPGKLPMKTCNLFAGEGGVTKSTVAISLACEISQGGVFPDGTPAPLGDTLIFSAEDPNGVVKKRIRLHGGNMDRIHKIDGRKVKGEDRYFDLNDLKALEMGIQRWPETKLIIIDPVASYVGGIDSHKNADVRKVMVPLTTLAEKYNVCVVLIIHLNKDEKKSFSNRISGSGAWRDLSRSVWFIVGDKDDPSKRHFLNNKQNYAPLSVGYTYMVNDGTIEWKGESTMKLDTSFDNSNKTENATEWLKDQLSDGPRKASEVITLADGIGISQKPLRDAREKLKVITERIGFGPDSYNLWRLPGTKYVAPSSETQSLETDEDPWL